MIPTPPRIRARKRKHRCFELVGLAMIENPTSGWSAVYGTYYGGIGHAWLEKAGYVFDVLTLELLPVEDYREKYQAIGRRWLSAFEVAQEVSASGRWDDLSNTVA